MPRNPDIVILPTLVMASNHYSLLFPSARTLAHLALAAAESLARTAGLLRQSFLLFFLAALTLAQRIFRALARAFMSLRLMGGGQVVFALAGSGGLLGGRGWNFPSTSNGIRFGYAASRSAP